MDEIQTETFRLDEWPMIFPGDDHYGLYSGTYSVVDGSQVADVTPQRIARVVAWDVTEGDCAVVELDHELEVDDGAVAACMAGCDSTGWDCQSGVEWRWAPSLAIVIEQGIDRWTRARLGLPLAIDAFTSRDAS